MPRPRRSSAVPGSRRGGARDGTGGSPPGEHDEPTLQLAVAREGVGLELSGAVDLGVVRLERARTRMVGVGFPLDLSGGVERFRHRRTALEVATVTVEHARAERWLSATAGDLLVAGPADARIRWNAAPRPDDAGETRARNAYHAQDDDARSTLRIEIAAHPSLGLPALLAFDVAIAPFPAAGSSTGDSGGGVVLLAHRPRGVELAIPPTALIGRLLRKIAPAVGGRARGLRLEIADVANLLLRAAFVTRGARLPTRAETVVVALAHDAERFTLEIERAGTPAAPSRLFVTLDELDRVISDADEAMIDRDGGEVEGARDLYLRALEWAPRHRTILTRLAECDAWGGSRGQIEAARGWLREAARVQARRSVEVDENEVGRLLLTAKLHAASGARGRAKSAWQRAAERALADDDVRLAARSFARAASLLADHEAEVLPLLDRALAADPNEVDARWRRVRARITAGDDARAMEDIQHLELQARGRPGRRAMLLRAGKLWAELGDLARAVATYERAIRWTPDDRAAMVGLAEALLAANEVPRAVALLGHASKQAGDAAGATAISLLLARALAEAVGDLPAAIARTREVGEDDPRASYARALEAVWRGRLGDRAGSERAWAAAADLCERRGVPPDDAGRLRDLFLTAARAAATQGGAEDATLAFRLALAGLAAAPHDEEARGLVTSLGGAVASHTAERDAPRTDPGEEAAEEPAEEAAGAREEGEREGSDAAVGSPIALSLEGDDEGVAAPEAEARAETLLARVKANPDDHAAVEELIGVLTSLGRDFELFALLQARYDEASIDERARLATRQRAILERLAEAAHARGRHVEAALYRDAAAALAH